MKRLMLLLVLLVACPPRSVTPVDASDGSSDQDASTDPDAEMFDARRPSFFDAGSKQDASVKSDAAAEASAPYPDADGTKDDCLVACTNLWSLGCPEASRNSAGETCPQVCRAAKILLDVACVKASKTVAAVRNCHLRCGSN